MFLTDSLLVINLYWSSIISIPQQLDINMPISLFVFNKSLAFSCLPGSSQCGTNKPFTNPRQSTQISG